MEYFGKMSMAERNNLMHSLVEQGVFRPVGDRTIYDFIGEADLQKLAAFERSYAEAFNKRFQERRAKETEAERNQPWPFYIVAPVHSQLLILNSLFSYNEDCLALRQ